MARNLQLDRPRRVLLIKPSALGDVVTGMPVLRGLRRSFGPDLLIDWLVATPYVGLLKAQSELNQIIPFDRRGYARMVYHPRAAAAFAGFCRRLRQGHYDWVIDLQGLFRSGFLSRVTGAPLRAGFGAAREGASIFYTHRLAREETPVHTVDQNIALARLLGIDAGPSDYRLTVGAEGQKWAQELAGHLGRPFVLIAPATRWATKLYPPHHWRCVIEALRRRLAVVLVAGGREKHLTAPLAQEGVVDLAGQTSLEQLIALAARARGVICCDSGVMHIAAAVGTPTVALMGPTDPAHTGPYGQLDRVLRSPVPCRGCLKRRCRHRSCMESIAPSVVLAAVEEWVA
jgi:lipopolysaccharide heptosyltransferase I